MRRNFKIGIGTLATLTGVMAVLATSGTFSEGTTTILLGNNIIEPWGYSLASGSPEAFKVKAKQTGTIGSFHIYVGELNTATSINIGLYSDLNGGAGNLLANGNISSPKKSSWNEAIINSTYKVEIGKTYWIAILGLGGSLRYRDAHQPCLSETSSIRELTSLPNTWNTGNIYPECIISAYISAGEEKSSTTTETTTSSTSSTPPPINPNSTAKNCFSSPGSCGYPDPKTGNVGANCSSLKPSGSVNVNTEGQIIEGLNIKGTISVHASNVKINNDCVVANGGGSLGSRAITIESHVNNTSITNSTVGGENESNQSIESTIVNDIGGSGNTAAKDYFYNCGECIHGDWTVNESYIIVNGMKNTSDHYEDWYFTDSTINANDDTMFNTYHQTAVIFGDTHGGSGGNADNHVNVTNSFIAGGGYMFYPDGNASSAGTSSMNISNNRFARCASQSVFESGPGGHVCKNGPDSSGYFPEGGYYGVAAYDFTGSNQIWSNNYWDNNLETAPQN